MSESLPRWGLPEVDFLPTNPEQIQSEIITKYEEVSGRTLAAADPVRLFLLSIADIIIQQRVNINIAAQQNLLSYATGEQLDALGRYLAVERLQEAPAITTIEFTLSQSLGNDYTIPANFEITNGIVTFATNEEVIIRAGDLTASIEATCTQAGAAGNDYLPGQISTIVKPQTFLKSAENTSITAGGADAEGDAEYAERIHLAPNSFSVAGSRKAYEFHTKTVSSAIIDVAVDSPSPGEVRVYPLLENGEMPTAEILDQVEAYLSSDTIRPLTDHVEALPPTIVEYSINVDYWISKEDITQAEQIRGDVEKAVEEFRFWQQTKIGRDISPDKLISNIMNAGASRVDFSTLSPAKWTKLQLNEVAQCTGVTITYKGLKEE